MASRQNKNALVRPEGVVLTSSKNNVVSRPRETLAEMLDASPRAVAHRWLAGLASRGLWCSTKFGRIRVQSGPTVSRHLSDAEVLVLRQHRAAIIEAITSGVRPEVQQHASPIEESSPAAAACPWCGQSPCVSDPAIYRDVHPGAADEQANKKRDEEMWACIGEGITWVRDRS